MTGREPLTPRLAVGAIVVAHSCLLMVRRGHAPGDGLWSLPGGKVEEGETLEAALRREVLEETDLVVEIDDLVGWVHRRRDEHDYVIVDFAAHLRDRSEELPTPTPADDAAAASWAPLRDVLSLALVDGLGNFLVIHGILDG
jgi:ADP-ribose pyrophosphatase YjhB (NUDIX family)